MINTKQLTNVNIAAIGVYIPPFRVTTQEIASTYQKNAAQISGSLGITQKSVADSDEDCLTMAVQASLQAFSNSNTDPQSIGAIFVGSESHPYAVKPTGTMVGEWLGINPDYFCADLQFACKAGTAGLQIVAAMIESGIINHGLVIGSDKAQSKPGDALEYSAASCAVAILLSRKPGIAKLNATNSYSSDTPDFWRRQTTHYPEHGGRFTGEPAYFKHVINGTQAFLDKYKHQISNFDHVVFHMPNGKFPKKAAKKLGVTRKQLQHGFTVNHIGNPYSSSSMLGLANTLANAKKGEEILTTSYGSGSGSDTFHITMAKSVPIDIKKSIKKQLTANIPVSYVQYLQMMKII